VIQVSDQAQVVPDRPPTVFDRVTDADLRDAPFPHFVLDEALPPDYYRDLEAAFPALEEIAGDGPLKNNTAYLRSAVDVLADPSTPPIWRDFFQTHVDPAIFHRLLQLWGARLPAIHPGIEENFGKPLSEFSIGLRQNGKWGTEANREHDVVMEVMFGINSPVTEVSSVRAAHVDSGAKLFSALIYFRDDADDSTGGEFEIFRTRSMYPQAQMKRIPERYLERTEVVRYGANNLVSWLNSARSVHAVSPRSVTRVPRRYVAISAECYGGRARDGFFLHDPAWETPLARLKGLFGR
jgi:hypothetical protein